jgi:2-oxoisovalerate dehydrogenase E1 component alpha subunit
MEKQGWISETDSQTLVTSIDVEVKKAFHEASHLSKPPISDLFTDVYNVLPWHLAEQQKQLQDLIDKYPDEYDLQAYSSDQK